MSKKNNIILDADYWNLRYQNHSMGWDIGAVSPALKAYIEQLNNKNLRILIPGAGNSYEADFLVNSGFNHITVLDFAPTLIENLKTKFLPHKQVNIISDNFFNHHAPYDLILEQTFFCALSPELRKDYVAKMKSLLAPNGKLVGLWFDCFFLKEGPPFGGNLENYKQLFEPTFFTKTLAPCYNSIPQRQGNEVFGIFENK